MSTLKSLLSVTLIAKPVWWRLSPALIGVTLFVVIGAASLAALLLYGDFDRWGQTLNSPYLWRVVRFSIWQALLSCLISIGLALPIASALMHQRFVGRSAMLQLFSITMVIPTIVAILGIVVIYGRQGWLHTWFGWDVPLYGMAGILLAHVFFNLPLAVRILLEGLALIPAGQWRLAYQLGLSRWQVFVLIEWHYVRKVLPGLFVLIFMLCFTSFAVVLSLGGGPKASTLEVAIYQALRFEFNIPKASLLSLLQVLICSGIALLVYRIVPTRFQDVSLLSQQVYPIKTSFLSKVSDHFFVVVMLLIIVPPFIAILLPLFSSIFIETLFSQVTWFAVYGSLRVAIPAATLSLFLGFCFAVLARFFVDKPHWQFMPQTLEQLGSSVLMIPGLVLATGLFLIFRDLGLGFDQGYWIVVWVNSVMALPFVLRFLIPSFCQQEKRYGRQYRSLGIWGWWRFRLEWPFIRHSLGLAYAYALLLSLGDMGVIALFGSEGLQTLPLYLYQLIGSYRLEQGATVAVILVLLCVLLFWLSTRFIGGKQHANA